MTRREYEVIAEIIAEMNWDNILEYDDVVGIAKMFAYKLKSENHKFNEKLFLDYVKERM